MKRHMKGQSLVEFALVVIFFIGLAILFVDIAPLAFNTYIAKQMSARGARAGSVYLADGVRTCYADVLEAIGEPWLPSASWNLALVGSCDADPSTTMATGTPIKVTIEVDYSPPFIKTMFNPLEENVFSFEVSTIDQAR